MLTWIQISIIYKYQILSTNKFLWDDKVKTDDNDDDQKLKNNSIKKETSCCEFKKTTARVVKDKLM